MRRSRKDLVPFVFIGMTVLLAAGLIPPAQAQGPPSPLYQVDADLTPHGEPLPPVHATGTARLDITVTCNLPLPMTETQEIHLNLTAAEPDVETNLDQSLLKLDRLACLGIGPAMEVSVNATFSLPAELPATSRVALTATAAQPGNESVIAQWEETVGFHERWSIQLDERLVEAQVNQTIRVEGTVTSASNGPMGFQISLDSPPVHGTAEHTRAMQMPYDPAVPEHRVPFHIEYHRERPGTEELLFSVSGSSDSYPSLDLRPVRMELRVVDPRTNFADAANEVHLGYVLLLAGGIGLLLILLSRALRHPRKSNASVPTPPYPEAAVPAAAARPARSSPWTSSGQTAEPTDRP